MSADRAASVLARLLNRSRSTGENYNLLLSRFVIERLLYRLSASPHADHFVLKGALLFALWHDSPHRPTKDADLLGFGADDEPTLRTRFTDICTTAADDGVRFAAETIRIAPIRHDTAYGGLRLVVTAFVGNARLPVQVDIGFGDAITPAPERVSFPTLLDDLPAAALRAYPVYTVIAEKLHAMVVLGMANTRMKDFFDLATIARSTAVDGDTLTQAIRATFSRRDTALPEATPVALTPDFATDPAKLQQWRAFQAKLQLRHEPLAEVVALLGDFLVPPLLALRANAWVGATWNPMVRQWTVTTPDNPAI